MANDEDVARIRQGVAVWNAWRSQNQERRVNLSRANLSEANLSEANLTAGRTSARRTSAVRTSAVANLSGANLSSANLSRANLSGANLSSANLIEANLSSANLIGANFIGANLSIAPLCDANLIGADLSGANLSSANLIGAWLGETVFANVNLNAAKGLDACLHLGPSVLDHRTLQRSGRLPLSLPARLRPARPADRLPALAAGRGNPVVLLLHQLLVEGRCLRQAAAHRPAEQRRAVLVRARGHEDRR